MIELEMTILERVGVMPIVEKMVETQLRWFGHLEIRLVDFVCSKKSRSDAGMCNSLGRAVQSSNLG
jgi:hypothetical protein